MITANQDVVMELIGFSKPPKINGDGDLEWDSEDRTYTLDVRRCVLSVKNKRSGETTSVQLDACDKIIKILAS